MEKVESRVFSAVAGQQVNEQEDRRGWGMGNGGWGIGQVVTRAADRVRDGYGQVNVPGRRACSVQVR